MEAETDWLKVGRVEAEYVRKHGEESREARILIALLEEIDRLTERLNGAVQLAKEETDEKVRRGLKLEDQRGEIERLTVERDTAVANFKELDEGRTGLYSEIERLREIWLRSFFRNC